MQNQNLIKRVFEKKKDSKDSAFATIANIIANTFEMSERQKILGDLMDYLCIEKRDFEGLNTNKMVCNCGSYTDSDNNLSFCDDCLINQL